MAKREQQEIYTTAEVYGGGEERVRRKWTISLALKNGETLTIAEQKTDLPAKEMALVSMQLAQWENLATKV